MSSSDDVRLRIKADDAGTIPDVPEEQRIYVSAEAAADILGVKPRALQRWAKDGLFAARPGKTSRTRGRPLWLVDLESAARLTWVGAILFACRGKLADILREFPMPGTRQRVGQAAIAAALACEAKQISLADGVRVLQAIADRYQIPVWAVVSAAVRLGNPSLPRPSDPLLLEMGGFVFSTDHQD